MIVSGGSGRHSNIHTLMHSHNYNSRDRSGVSHSDTTELNSNVPKPSRARLKFAEIERCNNIFRRRRSIIVSGIGLGGGSNNLVFSKVEHSFVSLLCTRP